MFIAHATFDLSNGRIKSAGVTPFSHCPNPADIDRAFGDYAVQTGYPDRISDTVWINPTLGEGRMILSRNTVCEEAMAYAEGVRFAAQSARTAAHAARAELAARGAGRPVATMADIAAAGV